MTNDRPSETCNHFLFRLAGVSEETIVRQFLLTTLRIKKFNFCCWGMLPLSTLRSPFSISSGASNRGKSRLGHELSYIIGAKLKTKRVTSITLDTVQCLMRSLCQFAHLRLQPSNIEGPLASCMLRKDGLPTALRPIQLHRCHVGGRQSWPQSRCVRFAFLVLRRFLHACASARSEQHK